MEQHLIPAEYGLILSAFSHSPTIRGAAKLLNLDPSGLVRKFQKMSAEYGLLQKSGNKWFITARGQKLNRWYDESVVRQKLALNEKPAIRISSFSWLAEQSLIPNISYLSQHFPGQYTWSFKTNSGNLEQDLIYNRTDIVITGHPPSDPMVAHKKVFTKDWQVVAPISWQKQLKGLKGEELEHYLMTRPFIRLTAKSPHEMIKFRPQTYAEVDIDGVIGLRTAVAQGLGWSCVPAMSMTSLESKLIRLDLPTTIQDNVSYWWLRSRTDLNPVLKKMGLWLGEMA